MSGGMGSTSPMISEGFGVVLGFDGSSMGSISPKPSPWPNDSQPARSPLLTTVDNMRSKSSFLRSQYIPQSPLLYDDILACQHSPLPYIIYRFFPRPALFE